jgi:hypothetical protein
VLAAESAHLPQGVNMVAYLIAGGADVNARDAKNLTALEHCADLPKLKYKDKGARENNGKALYILASRGADSASVSAARRTIFGNGYPLYDTLLVRGRQQAAGATRVASASSAPAPRQTPKAAAKPPAGCKPSSVIRLESPSEDFAGAQPIDLRKVPTSVALAKSNGSELKVFLATGPWKAPQMDSSMMIQPKKPGDAVLVLKFMNGKEQVAAGEYKPSAGWGKPHSVLAEVQVAKKAPGTVITMVTASSNDKGSATISSMQDGWVCGSFDLDGSLGGAAGTFAAPIQ